MESDFYVTFVGEILQNSYYKNLVKKIREYGLDRKIHFTGLVNESKLREYYLNCAFGIYTPIREDFGMIPLEFNSAGKICLSVDEGGCIETTPLRHRFSNSEGLGKSILKLMDMSLEGKKKEGELLRKRAKNFSSRHFIRLLEKVEELAD